MRRNKKLKQSLAIGTCNLVLLSYSNRNQGNRQLVEAELQKLPWKSSHPLSVSPQVHPAFLNLFQCCRPGNLLFEILVFAERLSEGRNSAHYRAVKWHYNEQSLHEALFGADSRLADRLLALVIHPEEDVQIQACKVIVTLQCPPDLGNRPTCQPACQTSNSFFANVE